MKKLFFLGALFAVGLGFTACSSDKDSVADVSGPIENGGGNYIAIGINLPATSTGITRAAATDNAGNVTYDDGMASEYAVKDATLLVFSSATGNAFKGAYTLNTAPWTNASDDTENVTEYSTKVVQKVGSGIVDGDLLMVILNNNGLVTVNSETNVTVGSATLSTTGTPSTYADFAAATASTTDLLLTASPSTGQATMVKDGFFMTNAPLSNKMGSTATALTGADIRILVPITKVYPTEAEAAAAAADQIYVERGMAKVTMEQSSTASTTASGAPDNNISNSKIDGSTALSWEVTGWTLDNTNQTTYIARSIEDDATNSFLTMKSTKSSAAIYRYIGNQQLTFPTTQTYGYRTYFAKDPNYDTDATFNRVTASTVFSTEFGDTKPQYCFENTFDVDHQNVNQTTLVQVAVQAKATTAEDLFTLNGNKTTIYTETSVKTLIANKVLEYLEANDAFTTPPSPGTYSSSDVTVVFSDAASPVAGEITIAKLTPSSTLKSAVKAAYLNGDDFSANNVVKATTEAVGKIERYLNGVSYYNIRIKHFGDLLCPWKDGETPGASLTNGIYPTTNQAENYLGRYGVLRNNWYNLKVTKIRSLGEATPHTGTWPGTPDDELDSYITFQINVLSWAKHVTQNAEL